MNRSQLLKISSMAFALLVGTTSCKKNQDESAVSQQGARLKSQMTPEAQNLWNSYVKSATEGHRTSLQPGCRPHHYTLPKGVTYKGVVILFHGFTACPQQFFEWAGILTQQGYEVLLPVMPGFGLDPVPANDPNWPEPVKDVVDYVPRVEDAVADPLDPTKSKYAQIAVQMNAVAQAAKGEKILGGISVGGAVAAHAANIAPNLYSKVILYAPFFAVDSFLTRQFIDLLNASKWLSSLDPSINTVEKFVAWTSDNPFFKAYVLLKESKVGDKVLSMRHSWGEGCYKERKGGRAGICDFLFSNLAAAEMFGLKVIETLKPAKTQFQFVGVEDDKVASNGHITLAIRKLASGAPQGKNAQGGEVSACFYRSGASHSLLSRYDNPDDDKFWLSDLISDSTRYVTGKSGHFFPTETTVSAATPYLHCRLSR